MRSPKKAGDSLDCQAAFENLKTAIIKSTVLSHPDYSSPFVLDTDATDNSLSAVLSNVIDGIAYRVAFASRVLSPAECKISTTKREALAVIQAMKSYKPYLGDKVCVENRPRFTSMPVQAK